MVPLLYYLDLFALKSESEWRDTLMDPHFWMNMHTQFGLVMFDRKTSDVKRHLLTCAVF
jgi:hypothetical protein